MQYRYYIGLSLPAPLRESIIAAQQELFDPLAVIQPLEPHITLLPPPVLLRIPPEELTPPLVQLAQPFLPLELRLEHVETFGRHTVAIHVESQELVTLQYELASILARWLPQQHLHKHRFHPHVTLNQAIRGTSLPRHLAERYRQRLASALPAHCQIDHLTLYEWQRPRYYTTHHL